MLNTKYIVTKQGVYPNPDAMGNAWFVNDIQFVPTPDDECTALNTLDLRTTAVADEKFREILTCEPQPNENDEITLVEYKPNKLLYTSNLAQDRIAVFSEIYYPEGWHLTIDGKEAPIGRVNYVLRAAVLPAGEHTVQMVFAPAALSWDKWCAALAYILLAISIGIFIGWPLYSKKKESLNQATL